MRTLAFIAALLLALPALAQERITGESQNDYEIDRFMVSAGAVGGDRCMMLLRAMATTGATSSALCSNQWVAAGMTSNSQVLYRGAATRLTVVNGVAMSGTDGCYFKVQRVDAAGTESDLATFQYPAADSVTLPTGSSATFALPGNAIGPGDQVHIEFGSGLYCENGDPPDDAACVCDPADTFVAFLRGTR